MDYKVILIFTIGLILIMSAFANKKPAEYIRDIAKDSEENGSFKKLTDMNGAGGGRPTSIR